ncbi:MAG: C40 family peptidase [Lachnospiraceae bacterium]|nr:C40 family peptidase [Lachnospiraceae bacterium]
MSECILRAIRKHRLYRITALIVAVVLLGYAPTAYATTIDDMQSEIDSINSEINDLENQKRDAEKAKNEAQSGLSGTNSQINSISGAMGDLDTEIEGINMELVGLLTDIDLISSDIENKTEEIAKTQEEYDEAVATRDEQYASMKVRIRYMYEIGDATYISIFLEATTSSLADALNKAEYVEQLYAYDRQMLEEYKQTVDYTKEVWDRLEEEKSELETSKEELEEEQKYLEEVEAQLEEEYENYSVMLAQARQQAAIYTAKINQQTSEIRSIEKAEAEKKREAEAKQREIEAEQARIKAEQEAEAAAAAYAAALEAGYSEEEIASMTSITSQLTTNNTTSTASSSSSTSSGTTVTASGSGKGAQIANYALQFVGRPYVSGGTDPYNGSDCSGFTMAIYQHFGISLPRTSYSQSSVGTAVSYDQARAGDIIYYGGHVGIYIGNGQIVHASTQRTGVKVSSATYRSIVTIRRVVN